MVKPLEVKPLTCCGIFLEPKLKCISHIRHIIIIVHYRTRQSAIQHGYLGYKKIYCKKRRSTKQK